MPGATIRSPSRRSIRAWRPAASPNCATWWRRCAKPASASFSTWSSTTPARATRSARRCRCAVSTTAASTATTAQDPGLLVNDTGTGNTIACDSPQAIELILDALRHFVLNAGVDGFRFDLAHGARPRRRGLRSAGAAVARDRRRSRALRPRADRRTLGYRAGRLSARQFSAALPRMERPFPRRRQALLARRPAA